MTQLGLHPTAAPLAGAATPAAQHELLAGLLAELHPLVVANKLPQPFLVQPGLRLSRSWGNCRYVRGAAPLISIRCTTDGAWRTRSAITLTLLHELAHLKYRSHGPRFWDLHRRLVDQATHAGLYHPHDDDAAEPAQGNSKLAGTAAGVRADAAKQQRQDRYQTSRVAIQGWQVGDAAQVTAERGPLAGHAVRVTKVGRTRLTVRLADGRSYSVPAAMLAPAAADAADTLPPAPPAAPHHRWAAGERARVGAGGGALAGRVVHITQVRRTRVIATTPDGRAYAIPFALLEPVD